MKTHLNILACVLLVLAASAAAEVVSLDISAGFTYDGYISDAEADHAYLYNPPGDWGLSSRMVHAVFGDHSTSPYGRNYAWQAQVPQGGTGLPDNGQITTSYGTFALCTTLDAEPVGGFVQTTKPTCPTGILPIAANVVRAYRPHTGQKGTPDVSASVTLPGDQQDYYDSINFLLSGSNGKVMIYADYDDGQGGVDQQLIYTSPGTPKTPSETGLPDLLNSSSTNPDIVEVVAKVAKTNSFRRLLAAFLRPQRPPHHEGRGRQTAPPAARSLPMASMLPSPHPLSHDRGVLCKQKRVAECFTHSAAFF